MEIVGENSDYASYKFKMYWVIPTEKLSRDHMKQ